MSRKSASKFEEVCAFEKGKRWILDRIISGKFANIVEACFLCYHSGDTVHCGNFQNRFDFISCPFEFGLGKFALEPVVVFFSKNVKKITSVGSSAFQTNL